MISVIFMPVSTILSNFLITIHNQNSLPIRLNQHQLTWYGKIQTIKPRIGYL